ncbi:MAG: SLC13 family permease [Acidobacteria bacterium]|nr:SLC13 family permease [Acidobacteriota bacterium]
MFEMLLASASFKIVATLLILLVAIYGFVSERIPPDVTALLALLALLLTGVLTPTEAFAGFSHPATVSVAAVLVLSAGIERSGALGFLARRVLAPLGKSEWLFTAVIMLLIGSLSAFINNTAAVAVFIPAVLEVCRRTGVSPGRVLMPMSHAATFGGMCTLIGTSTNLVAHEFARTQGLPGFSMFELGKVGLPMLLLGSAYILLVGRWMLPRNQINADLTLENNGQYLAELIVPVESAWHGREVRPEHLARDFEIELVELVRQGKPVKLTEPWIKQFTSVTQQHDQYQPGDSLWVRGTLKNVLALAAQEGLELHRPADSASAVAPAPDSTEQSPTEKPPEDTAKTTDTKTDKLPLAEVVVLSTSGLLGRTLKETRFAERFDAVVLALRRRGNLRARPSTTPLHAGDMLVVEGASEALEALADTPGFLVVGTHTHPDERPGKLVISVLTLIGVIALVSLNVLPIVTAAIAGCAVLMLTNCLRPREAYQAIDLSLVFLLAGSLALGAALEKTGLTKLLAQGLAGLGGRAGPLVMVAGFFFVAVLISEFMSNSGTVALLGPVALSSAAQMHLNPMALLAAVTFGSSAAFAMPIGYQTSLMILGPGGYRIKDFVKLGIVLDLLLGLLALWLIPRFWPLTLP